MVDGRADKKLCSPTCRKRWSRWKGKIARLEMQCQKNLDNLSEYLTHFATRESAAQAVRDIRTRVTRVMVENDIKSVS